MEGTTTLFEVDYFERSAYLTQSGQLYQEAGATAFGKTYCFGPCFRAEKSKTRRHLTEFWMVEPEMAFVELDENMTWAENLVGFIIQRVLENCQMELESLERDITLLESIIPPFPRITYDELGGLKNEVQKIREMVGVKIQESSYLLVTKQITFQKVQGSEVLKHCLKSRK